MKRKIIIGILLFLLFSIAAGLIYLNNVYLPIKIKARLINALQTSLNYNVGIEKIRYNLIRGLIIQDIVIYDKTKDKENTILTVKEVSFNFLFLPLIKERKIIIPIIHINSPYVYISYKKDDDFNFSRIFVTRLKPPPKQKTKFSFLIYKINIFGGTFVFEDEHLTPKFSKTIQDLNIGCAISSLTKISFLMQAKLINDNKTFTKLSLQGDYGLLSKELNSKLNFANLIVTEFNPYLKMLPLSINSATIENTDLNLKFKDNIVSLKGIVYTKGMELVKENLTLTGDINIEPDFNYNIEKKKLDYKANFKFVQAGLKGIKYIEKIDNISGDIGLIKDKLWTDNLKLQALDSAFVLSGGLENFLNPYLKINLVSPQFNLEKLFLILPHPQGLKLSGVSKVNIDIEGNLKKLPLDTKANFDISDARLETTLLKEPINNISGKIDLTLGGVDWQNLSFNYRDITYTSTVKLVDFKEPGVNFGLSSKDLDLKTDFKVKDKIIKISAFNGKFVDSKFDINGDIDIQDNANPSLDLFARLNLNVQDILIFLPNTLVENLKKTKLDGNLNITGSLNGKAKDYKDWSLSVKIVSDILSLYNLKFGNLSFNLKQKDGILDITRFDATGYSGRVNLEFSSHLKTDIPSYTIKFNSSDIDLAKLKLDTDLKDKDISGILNISADLYANFKDLSSLKGSGSLSIKSGKLWQLNLFKGLGELFLLPDYEKIIFNEATADFNVEDKSVLTENLRLKGEQLILDASGKLGFDSRLDFRIYTQVNKNLIRDSADIRKFISAIVGELSNAIAIKVSGTIQKPKYNIVPMPLDLIKSIKDFFLGK